MAENYNEILEYIHKRFMGLKSRRGSISESKKPLEIERKFLDFLKLIIEGGWIVKEVEEWF